MIYIPNLLQSLESRYLVEDGRVGVKGYKQYWSNTVVMKVL